MQFSTIISTVVVALTAVSAAPIPVNVQELIFERRATYGEF